MRRLFFGIALAAGMLGLWGWDAGVVAAQKPPVATDTETAAKLDRLQWRLDELERKEREYLGLRERDQKEMEKRLREFEGGVKLDVEKETQNAKAWVENKEKIVEWGLDNIAAFGTIISILFAVVAAYSFNTSRTAKKEMEMTRKLREESQEHCRRTDDAAQRSEDLYKKLENRLNNVTEALFSQIQNNWERAASLWGKSLQTDPEYTEAFFGLAVSHQLLAETASSSENKKTHLRTSCKSYNTLLETQKDNHVVLDNLGVALGDLASPVLTPDPEEQRQLLLKACEKHEQACRINPDYHNARNNWGIAIEKWPPWT
jgi:tetratricopeptide (TPR) repeat protein